MAAVVPSSARRPALPANGVLPFLEQVRERAWAPTDAASLGAFRFLLGALLAIAVVRHWAKGGIADAFVVPTHFFPYEGLEFVKPLPGHGMYGVYLVMALSGLGLALGWRSRASAAVAFVTFTYAHLCDKTNYLNHYYLLSLLLGLSAVLPLGAALSLDARRNGAEARVPAWMLWLVRFQIGLVYFYGGVGKLGADWLLRAMPLQIWLAANGDFPLLGPILRRHETAFVMSWVGALFDLSIAFFLVARRTRRFAYLVVIFFHVMTARLFQIGMFPWVMISLTLVFFDPSWPRRFLRSSLSTAPRRSREPSWGFTLAIVWAAFQFVYPLRSHLFTSDVLWTEDGYRFSWRVMLMEKAGSAEFTATDPRTGATRFVRVRDWLTPFQVKMMSTQPDMILTFARWVADDAVAHGEPRPRIYGDVVVSLNGRPAMRLIDPAYDLGANGATVNAAILPRGEARSSDKAHD